MVSSAYLRLLIFLLAILIPAYASSSLAFHMMYSAYKLNKQRQYTALTYSFSYLEPVYCSMSSYNCCFLICIQISQEAGQVVWCYHLLKNFTVYCGPHSQRFGIVNKAEVDVFSGTLAYLMIQQMLAIWSQVPLPFLNPAWTCGSSPLMYCWNLAWRILSITLLACEMSAIVW